MSPMEMFRTFDKGDRGFIHEDRFVTVLRVFGGGGKEDAYFRAVFKATTADRHRGMSKEGHEKTE